MPAVCQGHASALRTQQAEQCKYSAAAGTQKKVAAVGKATMLNHIKACNRKTAKLTQPRQISL